jgi:hypothetical protein
MRCLFLGMAKLRNTRKDGFADCDSSTTTHKRSTWNSSLSNSTSPKEQSSSCFSLLSLYETVTTHPALPDIRSSIFPSGRTRSSMHEMTENIPSEPGHLFLNHWSNGDPLWSAGPPASDTSMTVSYIKAYFNSTNTVRHKEYSKQCPTFDSSKVCSIPTQEVAPDGDNAKTYFFSQVKGKTPGQTIYHTTNGNSAGRLFGAHTTIYTSILVSFLSWSLL